MEYKIYINNQFYKTITTSNGYNYLEVIKDLQRAKDAGELVSFNVDSGLSVKVEQQ